MGVQENQEKIKLIQRINKMFKGKKALQIYAILGMMAIYAYVLQKLVNLNFFANVGFVSLVIYGFVALAIQLGVYHLIEKMAESK